MKNNNDVIRKILVITTEGCESCHLIEKLINTAIKTCKYPEIECTYQDVAETDKKFLKRYNITDFPTVLLIKNDIVRFTFTGTKPAIVISRWIDVQL